MNILLAIDDSKFGEAALRMLASQFAAGRHRVRILTVLEPVVPLSFTETPLSYGAQLDELVRGRKKVAAALLSRAAKKLRASGFSVSMSMREGDVRGEIVAEAEKMRARLIVMGSHSRRGLARVLLGSVSEYVARHAPCSVEIVRA